MDIEKDARFWLHELEMASKHERKWRKRAKNVLQIYKGSTEDNKTKFNILWSNTQTQKPALYSATPKPVVKRRHRQENPVHRVIATGLERSLEYSLDPGADYDFDKVAEKLIMDYLLPGRMVARVKYLPVFSESVREVESDEMPEDTDFRMSDNGRFIFEEKFDELVDEEVRVYHVPYDQYRQAVADHWEDVWWVAYGNNFLTREEIIDQFGEEHADVPLQHVFHAEDRERRNTMDEPREVKRAQVWEIWDRESRQVFAVVQGYDKLLMKEDDPLGLRGFFPQPQPVNIVECPNTLEPIPEYTLYQFQAEELNLITQRIENLVQAMKLSGLYPGAHRAEIERIFKSPENTLVPVEDWSAITQKGGLSGIIEWIPLKEVADAWQRLMTYRVTLIQSIYELTGISDIQRGATDPRETKGAQQLKANFATRRMLPKRQDTQRFFRDLFRLQAEIIAEHFETETILRMANIEPTQEELQSIETAREIMRDDALRSFAIDIETDSTIAADEEMDKQGVAEFTSAMSQFLSQIFPIVQMQPAAIAPLGKMMLWMSRKFRIARDAEDELEEFLQTFEELPDPNQAAAQAAQQQAQAEQEAKREEQRADMALKADEHQKDMSRKQQEHNQEMAFEREKHDLAVKNLQLKLSEQTNKIKLMREEAQARVVMEASGRSQSEPAAPNDSESPQVNISLGDEAKRTKKIRLVKNGSEISGAQVKEVDANPKVTNITFVKKDGKIEGAEVTED